MGAEGRQLAQLLCPSRSVLVVIDVQNDFCHPDGALGSAGLDVSHMDAMCGVIGTLHHHARGAAIPTIFLRTVHSAATDSAAWMRRSPYGGSVCREGTWGTEPYGIEALDGDTIVLKHRYGGFVGTRLEQVLRATGRTTLVLTGTSTNVCVETTAREACMRDYDVVVIEDAVASTNLDEHEAALHSIRRYFGSVVSGAAVLTEWARTTDETSPSESAR